MKDYSYIAALAVLVLIIIAVGCGKHPAIQDREDRKAMSSVEE